MYVVVFCKPTLGIEMHMLFDYVQIVWPLSHRALRDNRQQLDYIFDQLFSISEPTAGTL